MPYIKQVDRNRITSDGKYNGTAIKTAGELNYLLTIMFLSNFWADVHELEAAMSLRVNTFFLSSERRYQDHNDTVGALVCCLLEYKRRFKGNHPRYEDIEDAVVRTVERFYNTLSAPYEDSKIIENGDVI